jgi:hypothetical protein
LLEAPPEWLTTRVIRPLESTIGYRDRAGMKSTAFLVDLPSALGVQVGAVLASHGATPVPLYNAMPSRSSEMLVDVRPIMRALVDAAPTLPTFTADGPPAFLLDSRRMGAAFSAKPGLFDNRSITNELDFPSAGFLWDVGIERAVVIAQSIAEDLESTLQSWQARGIALWRSLANDEADVTAFTVKRTLWPLRALHDLRWAFTERGKHGAYGKLIERPSGG